jgi:hypothetical protein
MVHAHLTLRLNRRLGMKRDARPGTAQHPQIIRPVAHRQHIGRRDPQPGGDLLQRRDLGLAPQDRAGHLAGQQAICHEQPIGAVLIKPQPCSDHRGKRRKPPRHQRRISPLGLHRGKQHRPPRHQGNPLREHPVDHPGIQTLEQPHPLDQRPLEIQLAVHRPRRNGCDPRPHPGSIGQLVDALLFDHRAVHIGQQHPLGPAFRPLDDLIEPLILQALPHLPAVPRHHGQRKLRRHTPRQPDHRPPAPGIAQGIG